MKIVLVLLCDFFANYGRGSFLKKNRKGAYAPTTLTTLASLVPEELNAEIKIYDEFIEDFDPLTVDADLVGLSFTTPNAIHAYKLATILKKRGITVVLGGFHVSAMPDEASQYADACVIGYAERSWPMLLRDYSEGRLKKKYKESCKEEFYELKISRWDLLRRNKYFLPNTSEHSRSCVNNCSFCAIPSFNGNVMQYRSINQIVKEVRESRARNMVFLDSNPVENTDRFRELCENLKKLKIKWYSCISFTAAENSELIELMSESGCRGLLLGFESLNQNSLNIEGKGFNNVVLYKDVIKRLHSNNIYVFASFAFGFDHDTKEVFKKTVDFVNECNVDMINYGILTPFPGTPLFKTFDEQGRIITKNWSMYDSLHVTFKPKLMTVKELQSGFKWAYLKTHSLPSIIKRMTFSPTRSWKNFSGNIGLGIYGTRVFNKVK